MKISDADLTTIVDTVKGKYDGELSKMREENSSLRSLVNEISGSNYSGGVPNSPYNRGDVSEAFSFPINWALTCKQMGESQYIKPVLKTYKSMMGSFLYKIDCEDEEVRDIILRMHDGDIGRYLSKVFYNYIKYGFTFWFTKTSKGKYKGKTIELPIGIRQMEPIGINKFLSDPNDVDKLKSIVYMTAPKGTDNTDRYYADLNLPEVGISKVNLVNFDINLNMMGYATFDDMVDGDFIGTPFLYQGYGTWVVLNELDKSFYKNLKSLGEHSFTLKPFNNAAEITEGQLSQARANARSYIKTGGIWIDKTFYIERIDGIEPDKWSQFREEMVAELWKSLGVDSKSLGMTKGATRDLSEQMNINTLNNAFDMAKDFIRQYNDYLSRVVKELLGYNNAAIIIESVSEEVINDKDENVAEFSDISLDSVNPLAYEFKLVSNNASMITKSVYDIMQAKYMELANSHKSTASFVDKDITNKLKDSSVMAINDFISAYVIYYNDVASRSNSYSKYTGKELASKIASKVKLDSIFSIFTSDLNISIVRILNSRKLDNKLPPHDIFDSIIFEVNRYLINMLREIYLTGLLISANENDNICARLYMMDTEVIDGIDYYLDSYGKRFYDEFANELDPILGIPVPSAIRIIRE